VHVDRAHIGSRNRELFDEFIALVRDSMEQRRTPPDIRCINISIASEQDLGYLDSTFPSCPDQTCKVVMIPSLRIQTPFEQALHSFRVTGAARPNESYFRISIHNLRI